MTITFGITFGALAPPIDEQLRDQGLKLGMDPLQRQLLQRDIDEVARLKVRSILTNREAESARKRIMATIKKQARPHG